MKKFYAFAVAALAALTMNATVDKIYVVGAGDGLTWNLPGTEYEAVTPGVFKFTIENLTMFKMATVMTTDWDDETTGFNANCFGTGETTFTAEGVVAENGQTLPLVHWGENQTFPYAATYEITVDFNAMTMTAKAAEGLPTDPAVVYVRGTMNEWGTDSKWQLKVAEFTDYAHCTYTFYCEGETAITTKEMFKFADSDWGNFNFGVFEDGAKVSAGWDTPLKQNGSDMALTDDFEGLITLTINGFNDVTVLFDDEAENGVKGVEIDSNLPVEYFNLQGVRVNNPENGLFIARQGKTVTKVVK